MKRFAEVPIFAALAVALHVAVFASRPETGAEAGGVGGDAMVTLAAAAPTVAEMVETWDRPPTTSPTPTLRAEMPEISEAPDRPRIEMVRAPRAQVLIPAPLAPPPSSKPDRPLIDTSPPVPGPPKPDPEAARQQAPDRSAELEPVSMPEPRPIRRTAPPKRPDPAALSKAPAKPDPAPRGAKPARRTTAGQAGQKAAGSGGGAQAGNSGTAEVKVSKGRRAKLKAVWGARIRARIQKRLRKPGRTETDRKVVLRLVLSRQGTVLSAKILRSSGEPAFDRAALKAVSVSGRFPPAPKKLPGDRFQFGVPITFSR
jgi:protein TonB